MKKTFNSCFIGLIILSSCKKETAPPPASTGSPTYVSYPVVPKANFGGIGRAKAVGFSIGIKGYIGTGTSNDTNGLNDFWEWDQAANTWTQMANFGGTPRMGAVGFSIGTKGYIGTGYDGANKKDFWEWDQATNTWMQKANFGGTARAYAVGFSIGTKAYIGTGDDGVYKNDFWEWDQATNVWIQKTNFSGTARRAATGFTIASKGYIMTGQDYSGNGSSELWEWDQNSDSWVQKASLMSIGSWIGPVGGSKIGALGLSIGTKGYIIGGNSIWPLFEQWDQATDTWSICAYNDPGLATARMAGFTIGSKGYLGTGFTTGLNVTDQFLEFCEVIQ